MSKIFNDEFLNGFGTWPLGYIPYGGADFGEVAAVAAVVGDGDESVFHDEWVAAAERHVSAAETAGTAGNELTARDHYLRASVAYGTAYHPLFGEPVDPRLTKAFSDQTSALDKGLALGPSPATPLRIPFEGIELPGYFIPAPGQANEIRPLIIFTNGYDATMTDLYFASAVAAGRRGYHSLVFDGPGQGGVLYEHGVRLRPDWETVINAVVDVAAELPLVDTDAIALSGWSLGGYLAPRAASGEPRLAACIADPAQFAIADAFRLFAQAMGADLGPGSKLGDLDQNVIDGIEDAVRQSPALTWSIRKRGFWVNGVSDMRGFLSACERYTLEGRVAQITCPTLITKAENDPLAAGAEKVYDGLTCPKKLIRFTAEEGAGEHCEMMNRSLINTRALDWLDGVLAGTAQN